MEFQVTTDLSRLQPREIQSNFTETKEWLQNALAPYQSMVVSEDAIASAKSDRATINRLKKTLDEKRKAVKKQWAQPYIEWESKVNELLKLCDSAANNIDVQVKNFENQLKEQKKAELKEYFNEQVCGACMDFYITFDDCFNDKWLNAGTKIDAAKNEIDEFVQKTVDDIQTIADLESENAEALFLDYKENHDLRRVLARDKALREIKAAHKAQQDVVEAFGGAGDINTPSETKTPQKPAEVASKSSEKMYDLLLQLKLTLPQAKNIKRIMAELGIEIVQSKMKESKE